VVSSSAEQVDVKMIHGLAAVFAGVDDDAVAFGESFIAGYCGSRREEMAEDVAVFITGGVERGKVFARNDEDVDGRYRMNVGKGVAELILVDGGGRDGAIGDFAEEAGHGVTSRARPVYNQPLEHWIDRRLWLEKFLSNRRREEFRG
jgi:hypothetical protein